MEPPRVEESGEDALLVAGLSLTLQSYLRPPLPLALPLRALLLLHLTLQLLGSGKRRIERLFLTWGEEKISHSGLVRNVETTLYVAPQLVPKRVMEPEVATQFGYSLVGLLHLYHDYVLWNKESADKDPPTGSHNKRGWAKSVLRLVLLAQRRRAMMLRGGKYKGVEESAEEDSNKIMFEDATIEVAEGSREDLLVAGEVCHILRPVVLALSAAAVKPAEPKMPVSADKRALLLYLLRDPVFATVTKPATRKAADVLDYVPVVGKFFRFVQYY
ncbi:hypothetical protein PR002_g23598 [Phytophthora rubi]|uniref:Peroxisomal membrane protein PEX16 n=1 Tax=Phytophthora rubi TaxID=129364 RepID=A0A6A3IGD5_9STRA|nr:hypothetical protein PR002_g23598 [Phytophthora rubi]